MKPMLCGLAPADFLALKYPLAAEIKYDGIRCVAVVSRGKCTLYSRTARILAHFGELKPEVISKGEGVYDGEIISPQGFEALLSKYNSDGPRSDIKVQYKIFDKLTLEEWNRGLSKRPYSLRCKDIGEKVIIKNPASLEVYYNHVIGAGHEGLILKQLDSPYVSGDKRYWFKLKPKETIDLQMTAFDLGMGKYEGTLGAIFCTGIHEGKPLSAYVGTGFSDEDRKSIWHDRAKLANKFIEIEYQEITKPTGRHGECSLRFPVFKRLRLDKS